VIVLNKRLSPDADTVPGYIYVGRPSQWGNPFRAGVPDRNGVVFTRQVAVDVYREYAKLRLEADPDWLEPLRNAEGLVCWCAPLACHADVLVELLGGNQ
jgi:Domain of unknown function (DUF4326)